MLIVCGLFVASFPDSAQFSTVCSMKKWERVSSAGQRKLGRAWERGLCRYYIVSGISLTYLTI